MQKVKIGEWLKFKRKEVGLRVEDFAALVGCSHHTINNIESGFNTYFKAVNGRHPYRPGVKLMEAIAGQFEKSMDDVYRETDYQDLTMKKQGFGQKLPGQKRGKKTKKEENAVIFELPKDRGFPPIKYFIIKRSKDALDVIAKECDNIDFAKGYIDAYKPECSSNIFLMQGYLKEVQIEG